MQRLAGKSTLGHRCFVKPRQQAGTRGRQHLRVLQLKGVPSW